VPATRDVEVQLGDWYTTALRPQDVSSRGLCVTLPGGAVEGARYRVVMRDGDRELALVGEVRWSKQLEDGSTLVGMSWVHEPGTETTLQAFFEQLSG
jgi:hypothetical protein